MTGTNKQKRIGFKALEKEDLYDEYIGKWVEIFAPGRSAGGKLKEIVQGIAVLNPHLKNRYTALGDYSKTLQYENQKFSLGKEFTIEHTTKKNLENSCNEINRKSLIEKIDSELNFYPKLKHF